MFDDIYLIYIQFRTLHRRIFTNNLLFKMNKKDPPVFDFCHNEEDSNGHVLIECKCVQKLWREMETLVLEIGVLDYTINEEIIIFGEML